MAPCAPPAWRPSLPSPSSFSSRPTASAAAAAEDLSVGVSARPLAKVGDDYRAQVSVPNAGSDAVSGVQLEIASVPALEEATIRAPRGVTCTSVSPSSWTCDVASIRADASAVLTVKGRIAPGFDTQVTTATLRGPAGADATASASTAVSPRADVSLLMAAPVVIEPTTGDVQSIDLVVSNNGPSAVDTTVVLVAPRAAWEFSSSRCDAAHDYGATLRRIICHVDTLPAGQTLTLNVAGQTLAAGEGGVFAVAYPDGAVASGSRVYLSTIDPYLPHNGDALGAIAVGTTKTIEVPVTADAVGDYSATGTAGSSLRDTDAGNNSRTLSVSVSAARDRPPAPRCMKRKRAAPDGRAPWTLGPRPRRSSSTRRRASAQSACSTRSVCSIPRARSGRRATSSSSPCASSPTSQQPSKRWARAS